MQRMLEQLAALRLLHLQILERCRDLRGVERPARALRPVQRGHDQARDARIGGSERWAGTVGSTASPWSRSDDQREEAETLPSWLRLVPTELA